LKGNYGIPDILNDPARIDSELVRSTALTYSDQLHAVINPIGLKLEKHDFINYEHLDIALDVFKQTYAFTVVDAPRLATDVTAMLVDASDIVLLPFQLIVKDIRHVRAMLAMLREVCTSAPHIDLVATRYRKRRTAVTLKEAALALDGAELTCLRNDFASASKAMNFGQPLAQATPLSKLRRDIAQLALNMRNRQPLGTKV
jgi:Flp pilus assembly CpaE family ATPase